MSAKCEAYAKATRKPDCPESIGFNVGLYDATIHHYIATATGEAVHCITIVGEDEGEAITAAGEAYGQLDLKGGDLLDFWNGVNSGAERRIEIEGEAE